MQMCKRALHQFNNEFNTINLANGQPKREDQNRRTSTRDIVFLFLVKYAACINHNAAQPADVFHFRTCGSSAPTDTASTYITPEEFPVNAHHKWREWISSVGVKQNLSTAVRDRRQDKQWSGWYVSDIDFGWMPESSTLFTCGTINPPMYSVSMIPHT